MSVRTRSQDKLEPFRDSVIQDSDDIKLILLSKALVQQNLPFSNVSIENS